MAKAKESVQVNGTILRTTIQERGLTQSKVAELIGVSGQAVTAWIWGQADPLYLNFLKLCEVLDVPPKYLALKSSELVERGQTNRVLRFHVRELLGLNEPPTYREIQDITEDLQSIADGNAAEDETKVGTITVSGQGESHPDPKSDNPVGDVKHGTRDNGVGDSGIGEDTSDASAVVSTALSDS